MPHVLLASAVATLMYVLPAIVAALGGARRGVLVRSLDAATAMALDAMGVLLLARLVPLGDAACVSRALWLLALAAAWRRGAVSLRGALPLLAVAAICAGGAALALHRLSFELVIWDRDWHIPLVSALRAQRAPFDNVFLPQAALRYHYLGDVAAAVLQALAMGRINASRALSLTHDVHIALLSTTLVAGCWHASLLGRTRHRALYALAGISAGLLGAWATTFASPFVLTHAPLRELLTTLDSGQLCGHSYLPFASISYRPHVGLAAYFMTATFVATAGAGDAASAGELRRRSAAALSSACALALCDEASHALIAASLGAAALLVPGALGGSWRRSLVVALAFGALLPLISAGFDASLGLGGAASSVELVPARHLKLFEEPIPYSERAAFYRVLRRDYFPQLSAAGLCCLYALWCRRRSAFAVAIFFVTLVGLSLFCALRVEVNRAPDEGHRFVTASMVLAPVASAWLVAAARGAWPLRAALLGVVIASGGSGWAWRDAFIRHRFVAQAQPSERRWTGTYNPNDVDCLQFASTPRRGPPPVEYLDADIAYIWAGCQPVRVLGGASKWNLAVHGVRTGWAAGEGYRQEGAAVVPTSVVCETTPRSVWRSEPCAWATARLQCTPVGRFSRCALPPAQREAFFDTLR